MKISELKERWNTYTGSNIRDWVIKALKNNTSLEGYVEKHNGKWDLRGIKLTTPLIRQQTLSNYIVSINDNTLHFKRVCLKDIDLSYADLSYTFWTNCNFESLVMHNTNFTNVRLWACDMKNCDIEKTNFSGSLLGSRRGRNSGSYENTIFKSSNFKSTAYSFPLFNNCKFIDCDLNDLNFDGSRFENCVFKGKLYAPIFRAFTTNYERRFFWERSIDPKGLPNRMLNVDFSEAQLYGVSFIDGVDISTCKFPSQGDYLLINDPVKIYTQAYDIINNEWHGEDKRLGLKTVDGKRFDEHKKQQKQDILDKAIYTDFHGSEFADKFFDLIKQIISGS